MENYVAEKTNKIVTIGCGFVGISFTFAAMIQNLADNYILIDINNDLVVGDALDLEDINANLQVPFKQVKVGTYTDCKDPNCIKRSATKPIKLKK